MFKFINNSSRKSFFFKDFFYEMANYRSNVYENAENKEAELKGFDALIDEMKRREQIINYRYKMNKGKKRLLRIFYPIFLLLIIPFFIFSCLRWLFGFNFDFDISGTMLGDFINWYQECIE